MLTCRGATFAGRVGATLLLASDLPELIADSPQAYQARLLDLVANPERLRDYRRALETTRHSNPLFDTAGFVRDWEVLLSHIHDRVQAGGGQR